MRILIILLFCSSLYSQSYDIKFAENDGNHYIVMTSEYGSHYRVSRHYLDSDNLKNTYNYAMNSLTEYIKTDSYMQEFPVVTATIFGEKFKIHHDSTAIFPYTVYSEYPNRIALRWDVCANLIRDEMYFYFYE